MSQLPEPASEDRAWAGAPEPSEGGESPSANLPFYPTPMIGREADRERLRMLLLEQGHRMVVITGSGGIGKTRLAVQVAAELEPSFRHGTRFLSFASVPRNADLDAAFAWHLGLRDTRDQSYRESIRQRLQDREQLLVVDNMEHLPELADLLVFVQQTCATVSMIITSRSELHLYGEVTHQLDSLRVRPSGRLLRAFRPDEVRDSPAVRLLVERARAVDADFTVTDERASVIAEICDVLGGVPLALELIASQLAHASPERLLSELRDTIGRTPPVSGQDLGPAISIQQSMRLSYEQLDETEQWVFRVLSIMHGQWTVDDVLPLLAPEVDESDAISLVDTLAMRSLVSSPTDPTGDVRFFINPLLQQFGRRMLAERGEHNVVADRHANRLVALAEEAEPELTGGHQQEWLARIDALHDDFRHAHEYLRDNDQPVDALRLATALWRYAYTRGHYRELRRWIEVSVADVDDHDALRARGFNGIGFLANVTRDYQGTRIAHERALELAAPLGLHREIAVSRIGLADIAVVMDSDIETALQHLELAANAYEQLRDSRGLASVFTNRGNIEWHDGDLNRAFSTHEQARMLYQQGSDIRGMAWSDTNTGRIAAQQGRHHDAVPRLLAALDGYLAIGDAYGIAEVLEALTGVAVAFDDLHRASALAGAAVQLRETYDVSLKSPDLEEFQKALEAAREDPDHELEFSWGRELSPEQAVALARTMPIPTAAGDGRTDTDGEPDMLTLAHERFGLTRREHQVLVLVDVGMTDQEIADRLRLSRRTVQTYIRSLLRKIGVSSRVSAVREAHGAGILPRP
jgi:predicted ATPase/DNA-binding CsgD family transcriptional regulator